MTALQLEVARWSDVGLAIVIHDLALAVFCEPWDNEKRRTEMTPGISDVSRSIPDAETSKVILEMNGVLDGWRNRLPKDARELWPWLLQQEQGTLLELLSVVVAPTINAIHLRHEKHVPPRIASGHRLAQTLGLDMTKYWQADAGFLSRISKSAILAAIAEGVSPEDARSLDRSSKAELVPAAERKLAGSGWLPLDLRTPENVEEPATVVEIDEDDGDGDDLDRKAAE